MGHSRIFQISSRPIDREEWSEPSDYYENSDDFADYIGDRVDDDDKRDEDIGRLADTVKDVFTPAGRGVLAYRGREALMAFKQKWHDAIKAATDELTVENMTKQMRLGRLSSLTEQTHLLSSYRVHIVNWTSCPLPLGELFEWAESILEEGDRVYIGAVIDYHI